MAIYQEPKNEWAAEWERTPAAPHITTLMQDDYARAQAMEMALRMNLVGDVDSFIAAARKIAAYLTGKETA
jgi:hypothetical protein